MSQNYFVPPSVFEGAVAASGLQLPSSGATCNDARAQFDALLFRITRRLVDVLRVVSHQRTLQPESVHNLIKIASMISTPIGRQPPSSSMAVASTLGSAAVQRGGTVMTGSFFDASNAIDAASYNSSLGSGHAMFTADNGSLVRNALQASFEPQLLGGGAGVRGAAGGWLPDSVLSALLREYRTRTAAAGGDLRVSDAARPALRRLIEVNAEAAMRRGCGGSGSSSSSGKKARCPSATPSAIARASDSFQLVLAVHAGSR